MNDYPIRTRRQKIDLILLQVKSQVYTAGKIKGLTIVMSTNVGEVSRARSKPRFFYGWWLVLVGSTLHFFAGGTFYYGFTVFFNPIRQTFGWSAASTSIAFTFQRLQAGILAPLAGFMVDKIGPRKLMVLGWSMVGLGFVLMSRVNSLPMFYMSFLITAIGTSFGLTLVINATIANWFARKRSRALAFIYIGPGLGGMLVPLLAYIIAQLGWREALAIVGVSLWAVGIPLSFVMRHKPAQYGLFPDGADAPADAPPALHAPLAKKAQSAAVQSYTARQAMRTSTFWLLSTVSFFHFISTSGLMVHIVPYLESVNVPTAIAALSVTGVTLCSLIGRVGFGFLGDYFNKRYLFAIAVLFQITGLVIFSFIDASRVWLIIPFLLTFAPGYGGQIPILPALQADYFGTKNLGGIMGMLSIMSMLAALSSPVIAGWVFDIMGSYRLAWQIFAMVTVVGIPLILLAKAPKALPGTVARPAAD